MAESLELSAHGDVAKLLEKLPSLISDAHHSEIWGIQLDGDDDKRKEIVIKKVRYASGNTISAAHKSTVPRTAFNHTLYQPCQGECLPPECPQMEAHCSASISTDGVKGNPHKIGAPAHNAYGGQTDHVGSHR